MGVAFPPPPVTKFAPSPPGTARVVEMARASRLQSTSPLLLQLLLLGQPLQLQPSLGQHRWIRSHQRSQPWGWPGCVERACLDSGPPFQVLSGPKSNEAGSSSVVWSPPLELFLYLSQDNHRPAGIPFPEVTSQDTLFSSFLSDSALLRLSLFLGRR